MPNDANGALLYLHALTSLHPGSGTALGAVDLPVQRERHTGWPVIPGTSLKGVLRDACRRDESTSDAELRLFGRPENEESNEAAFYAGALSFTDARLLAFPVRSLKGVFAWVTCKQALERWRRDAELAGITIKAPESGAVENEALVPAGSPCVEGGEVVLEEFTFKTKPVTPPAIPAIPEAERKRIVILDDTDFTHFAQYATEVTARIRLDRQTKTVDEGALFYQELLPAETIFYSVVLAAPSRLREQPATAAENLAAFKPPKFIQVGGDETTGRGICELLLMRGDK